MTKYKIVALGDIHRAWYYVYYRPFWPLPWQLIDQLPALEAAKQSIKNHKSIYRMVIHEE